VALKMSFHYWLNRGQPNKKRFVTLTNSYHGETMAAMSVGDVPLFTETYKALLLTPSRCQARIATCAPKA
jgi:adenosylmethionine-8-amino-7-oxononanoate aminotransferase